MKLCVQELYELFDTLFPCGFAGPDVWSELAPQGWKESSLSAAFHPSAEQVWQESVRLHRNLRNIGKPNNNQDVQPEPTLAEIEHEYKDPEWDAERELRDLVGRSVWDVFSNNHDVVAQDGRSAALGSFRGSGGFIADYLDRGNVEPSYNYLDFYMGTAWIHQRTDLTPVYCLIFRKLRKQHCDWLYHFPRLYVLDMRSTGEALDGTAGVSDWGAYSPSEAVAREQEQSKADNDARAFRRQLDEAHRRDVKKARNGPPPSIVQAYRDVYGRLPRGWPPVPDTDDWD